MAEYLGETPVDIATHPEFSTYTPSDWALYYITRYGQIDGAHHKDWVLDQVTRILKGTPVDVKEARWSNGESDFRVNTGEPSQEYLDWVEEMLDRDEHGVPQYSYDEGIPP